MRFADSRIGGSRSCSRLRGRAAALSSVAGAMLLLSSSPSRAQPDPISAPADDSWRGEPESPDPPTAPDSPAPSSPRPSHRPARRWSFDLRPLPAASPRPTPRTMRMPERRSPWHGASCTGFGWAMCSSRTTTGRYSQTTSMFQLQPPGAVWLALAAPVSDRLRGHGADDWPRLAERRHGRQRAGERHRAEQIHAERELLDRFRVRSFFQIGVGPNLGPGPERDKPAHMVIAGGWTPQVGSFNVPVHAFFIPDVDENHRLGMTVGVNW